MALWISAAATLESTPPDNKNEKMKSEKDIKTTNFIKNNEQMYEKENVALLKDFFSKKRDKGIR